MDSSGRTFAFDEFYSVCKLIVQQLSLQTGKNVELLIKMEWFKIF
jgi:hypothetical protein